MVLPQGGISIFNPNPSNTAIVLTDPQNDFLTPGGKGYHLTRAIVEKYDTVKNLELLLESAYKKNYQLFVSPHYIYPHDYGWQMIGREQEMLLRLQVYQKLNQYSPPTFGADFVSSLAPYIWDKNTIIVSPHKVASPQTNDLIYQLRQRKKDQVILAGTLSNVCVESHMRHLIESGFRTAVVYDATATISEKAFQAAITNYHTFSSAVWTTKEAISCL